MSAYLGERPGGITTAVVDQQVPGHADVNQRFTVLLDRNRGHARVGHQYDVVHGISRFKCGYEAVGSASSVKG
jgi:hypothetical protein